MGWHGAVLVLCGFLAGVLVMLVAWGMIALMRARCVAKKLGRPADGSATLQHSSKAFRGGMGGLDISGCGRGARRGAE